MHRHAAAVNTRLTWPGTGAFRMGSAAGRLRSAAVRCSGAGLTRRMRPPAGPTWVDPGAPMAGARGAPAAPPSDVSGDPPRTSSSPAASLTYILGLASPFDALTMLLVLAVGRDLLPRAPPLSETGDLDNI